MFQKTAFRRVREEKSFTLIEVLFYVGVFVVLISIITLFAVTMIRSINKNHIKKEVAQGAYTVISSIIYEIENADSIYTPTSVFNSHPGQLSLRTTQKLPQGEQWTYVDFYSDNNRFYVKRESQWPQLLTSENLRIIDLRFQCLSDSSKTVRIFLTVDYNTLDPEYQYSYSLISSATIRK